MSVFLGYYRITNDWGTEFGARARDGDGGPPTAFLQMVQELPEQLPDSCTIVGSYAPIGGGATVGAAQPSVMIVETSETTARIVS